MRRCDRKKEEEYGQSGPDTELVGEVEEFIVCISWCIEVTIEVDEDGVEGARTMTPKPKEVV